ncbi:pilus assembly protein PilV, partial [Pseudomonas aeruginosa]
GWYMSDSTWVRSWMNKNVYTGGEMKAGKLTAEGRTEVGEYLQLKGVATEGADCSPNGLAGITSTGLWLSCQNGKWGRTAASMRMNTTAGVIKDWCTLHGQDSGMMYYDYVRYAITCGGRFCAVGFNQTFGTNYSFGLITEIGPGFNYPEPYKTPDSTNVTVTCVN